MIFILNFLFFLTIFFKFTNQQQSTNKIMQLDTLYNGTILTADGSNFYTLTIPKDITEKSMDLLLKIKEPEKADRGKEDFSDPDVYVSFVK